MTNIVNFPIAKDALPEFHETVAERIRASEKFVYIAETPDEEDGGIKYAFGHTEMSRSDLIILFHYIQAYLQNTINGAYDD